MRTHFRALPRRTGPSVGQMAPRVGERSRKKRLTVWAGSIDHQPIPLRIKPWLYRASRGVRLAASSTRACLGSSRCEVLGASGKLLGPTNRRCVDAHSGARRSSRATVDARRPRSRRATSTLADRGRAKSDRRPRSRRATSTPCIGVHRARRSTRLPDGCSNRLPAVPPRKAGGSAAGAFPTHAPCAQLPMGPSLEPRGIEGPIRLAAQARAETEARARQHRVRTTVGP
jgi:hypothetical protein